MAQLAAKLIFSVSWTEKEFVSEMKADKGLYVMVVRFLGIKKAEKKEKFKIVISESLQPLLAKFS